MRSFTVLGVLAVVLAGCSGGSGTPSTAVPAAPTVRAHQVPRHSWILPNAGKQWLLYVSDESLNTVDIYNYRDKTGKLYGQITGLDKPLGQCTDSAGNVYIAVFRGNEILEFAHGGIYPIASAYNYYGRPDGCSVDPTTGNVAVTSSAVIGYPGDIVVYAGGLNGYQYVYSGSSFGLGSFDPPAYDSHGNLFFEGETNSAQYVFGEIPAGGSMQLIDGVPLYQSAGIQWDGAYITAVDQNYQGSGVVAIHRVTVSGSSAKIVSTTILTDNCGTSGYNYASVYQPYIGGTKRRINTVVAGNLSATCSSRLNFWHYPNGGNPKRVMPADISPVSGAGASLSPPTGS